MMAKKSWLLKMFHFRGISSAPLPGADVFLESYSWSGRKAVFLQKQF